MPGPAGSLWQAEVDTCRGDVLQKSAAGGWSCSACPRLPYRYQLYNKYRSKQKVMVFMTPTQLVCSTEQLRVFFFDGKESPSVLPVWRVWRRTGQQKLCIVGGDAVGAHVCLLCVLGLHTHSVCPLSCRVQLQ